MKNLYLFTICLLAGLISCNNEQEGFLNQDETNNEVINFIYNGVAYSSQFLFNETGISLLNEKADKVYQELQEMPELVTVMGDTLIFYKNENEYLETVKIVEPSEIETKSSSCRWSITAYTTVGYKGETEYHSNTGISTYTCNKVRYDNNWGAMLLYKTAPSVMYTCIMSFYEDGNCSGRSLVFSINDKAHLEETLKVGDLRNYYRASWHRDWDNKISSFKVVWATS